MLLFHMQMSVSIILAGKRITNRMFTSEFSLRVTVMRAALMYHTGIKSWTGYMLSSQRFSTALLSLSMEISQIMPQLLPSTSFPTFY